MPITYNLDFCKNIFEGKLANDIENTLKYISDNTENIINFEEVDLNVKPDITYICDIGAIKTKRSRGHGPNSLSITQAESEIYTYEGTNFYAPSKIYIYSTYDCLGERPTLIIHETLHLFGLEHKSPYKIKDIMQPFVSDNCNLKIIDSDINYLKDIYA